ncbi:Omega-6 fatty acid desaturase, endoplasmic reticulum isozyme 2 [Hordeum vulgare]|nr:Omega-6 fatty acid desaturase, endoplasmic reticulum isozyme 2 [Hordeum vulgare]
MAGIGFESFTSRSIDHELIPNGPEEEMDVRLALRRSREAAVLRQHSDSQRRESILSVQPMCPSGGDARAREAVKALVAVDVEEAESHSLAPRIMHGCGHRNHVVVNIISSHEGSHIDLTSIGTVLVTSSDEDRDY